MLGQTLGVLGLALGNVMLTHVDHFRAGSDDPTIGVIPKLLSVLHSLAPLAASVFVSFAVL